MPAVRGRTLSTWGGLFTPLFVDGSTPKAPQRISLVSMEETASLDSLQDIPTAMTSVEQVAVAVQSREVT